MLHSEAQTNQGYIVEPPPKRKVLTFNTKAKAVWNVVSEYLDYEVLPRNTSNNVDILDQFSCSGAGGSGLPWPEQFSGQVFFYPCPALNFMSPSSTVQKGLQLPGRLEGLYGVLRMKALGMMRSGLSLHLPLASPDTEPLS